MYHALTKCQNYVFNENYLLIIDNCPRKNKKDIQNIKLQNKLNE